MAIAGPSSRIRSNAFLLVLSNAHLNRRVVPMSFRVYQTKFRTDRPPHGCLAARIGQCLSGFRPQPHRSLTCSPPRPQRPDRAWRRSSQKPPIDCRPDTRSRACQGAKRCCVWPGDGPDMSAGPDQYPRGPGGKQPERPAANGAYPRSPTGPCPALPSRAARLVSPGGGGPSPSSSGRGSRKKAPHVCSPAPGAPPPQLAIRPLSSVPAGRTAPLPSCARSSRNPRARLASP